MLMMGGLNKRLFASLAIVILIYINLTILFNNDNVMESTTANSFKLEHCDCFRTLTTQVINTSVQIPYNQTTCGRDAWRRGVGQKIVGFSFYGDINTNMSKKKGYFQGIVDNLKLMPRYYPGWVMRLYYDLEDADPLMEDLCNLACHDPNLDICYVRQLPGTPKKDASKIFAMNWRFFPTLDPQVDVYACRDLDSRFSDREVAAVKEWLESDMPIHSMRDHPAHLTPLLGASWGSDMRKRNARGRWRKTWYKMLKDPKTWAPRSVKGPDQEILARYVWPWGKKQSIQHDSYLCDKYPGSISWPTERKNEPNNFVASVANENDTLWKRCPKRCRRKTRMGTLLSHCA